MRFAFSFNRRVGAGTDPLLGSDTAPTGAGDLTATHVFKTTAVPSGTAQRIAIGYQYTGAGPAPNLSAKGYVYDGTSETWFTVDSLSTTLKPGDIAFLPLVRLVDKPQAAGGDPYASRVDSLEVALVVTPAGGEPDGSYSFFLGSDISDVPDEAASAPLPVGAATEAKQDDAITALGLVATEATLATLATEATVAALATEATLAAQSAKLPATLGQKAKAASLAVTLASDEDIATTLATIASHVQRTPISVMCAADDDGQIGAGAVEVGPILVTNIGAVDVYLQFFDAVALPANGTAPDYEFPIAAGQTLEPHLYGAAFADGCFWCASSTQGTKTITATAPIRLGAGTY
jgi:hypothetical protein